MVVMDTTELVSWVMFLPVWRRGQGVLDSTTNTSGMVANSCQAMLSSHVNPASQRVRLSSTASETVSVLDLSCLLVHIFACSDL